MQRGGNSKTDTKEMLKIKKTERQMKNILDVSTHQQTHGQRISKLEDTSIEASRTETQREKRMKQNIKEKRKHLKCSNICQLE